MWGRRCKVMVESGAAAPAFQLKSLDGSSHSLDSLLAGGPVLLVFFKIGCPVCQLTFPFLERMSLGTSTRIVGISQDDETATRNFNEKFGITFLTLLDPARETYPASNAYGISSVPSFFLIEPGGRVSTAFNGFSRREIESLGARIGIPPFVATDHVPEWKAG